MCKEMCTPYHGMEAQLPVAASIVGPRGSVEGRGGGWGRGRGISEVFVREAGIFNSLLDGLLQECLYISLLSYKEVIVMDQYFGQPICEGGMCHLPFFQYFSTGFDHSWCCFHGQTHWKVPRDQRSPYHRPLVAGTSHID